MTIHAATRQIRRPEAGVRTASTRGFTLVELMVVVGVIAVLAAILVPVLSAARDQAWRVVCANNGRQLAAAAIAYAGANDKILPMPNWASQENPPFLEGWLYKYPNIGVAGGVPAPEHRHAGLLWPYINNDETYRCPIHRPPYVLGGPTSELTSYLMNGAVAGYGSRPGPAYQITRFKNDQIMFWEAGDATGFNDGASYPSENISGRHGKGGIIACFDGHGEYMHIRDFIAEQTKQPGRLWCNPGSANGT